MVTQLSNTNTQPIVTLSAKHCFEFCVTLQPDCTHTTAEHACGSNWTSEAAVFNASSVNATARSYPNDEGGLVSRFPALNTKLGVVPPAKNWNPASPD